MVPDREKQRGQLMSWSKALVALIQLPVDSLLTALSIPSTAQEHRRVRSSLL